MRVFLDINILLDFFLERDPWRIEADAIWEVNRSRVIVGLASAATLPTLYYLIRRQADRGRALTSVRLCLSHLTIITVDRQASELAMQGPGADFEDNLQHACAVLGRADLLVTRDPAGFAGAAMDVLSPAQFLTRSNPPAPQASDEP